MSSRVGSVHPVPRRSTNGWRWISLGFTELHSSTINPYVKPLYHSGPKILLNSYGRRTAFRVRCVRTCRGGIRSQWDRTYNANTASDDVRPAVDAIERPTRRFMT